MSDIKQQIIKKYAGHPTNTWAMAIPVTRLDEIHALYEQHFINKHCEAVEKAIDKDAVFGQQERAVKAIKGCQGMQRVMGEVVKPMRNYRVKLVDNQLNDLSGKEYTTQSSVIIETGNVITMRFQNKIVLNAWVMGIEHDLIKVLPMDYTKGKNHGKEI